MSLFDKVVAAVTPLESQEKRMEARAEARARARPGGWLSQVIDHHEQIEGAFALVKEENDAPARRAAQKALGVLLTGHANAEETVLYPALVAHSQKGHAGLAYEEQAATKVEMALLEQLDPMSQDYIDKLEHIEGAVTHHMYQEESGWFLELKDAVPADEQAQMSARYREEIDRYAGAELTAA